MKNFFAFLFAITLSITGFAQSKINPDARFKVKNSPHFELIYEVHHESLADKYLLEAERSHEMLFPIFREGPEKTIIFLDDSYDSPNGKATVFPRPTITAYPVLPDDFTTISHYDDWPYNLIVHEYTHILNMEPTHGVFKPIRWFLGSIVKPNMLLPRWYTEGLAVEIESRFSQYGRIRSPMQKAYIRAMVADGTWGRDDIAQINETSIPSYPRGARPYFYGSLLWHEILAQKKDDIQTIYTLNNRYSSRFPYFLSGPIEDEFNKNYQILLTDAYMRNRSDSEERIKKIRNESKEEFKTTQSKEGYLAHSPAISFDQKKLAFVSNSLHNDEEIYVIDRSNQSASFFDLEKKLITSGVNISRIQWLNDNKTLIYSKIDDSTQRYSEFSDLYLYDTDNKKETALTKMARASEPAVSSDGKYAVFVQNIPGSTQLSLIDIQNKKIVVAYSPQGRARVGFPNFLSAQEILFTERSEDGKQVLRIFNLQNQTVRNVLTQFSEIKTPSISDKGVLFVSDVSGTSNIYLANKDLTDAAPLTNTITYTFNPVYDGLTNEIIYSRLQADGWALAKSTLPSAPTRVHKFEIDKTLNYKLVTPHFQTNTEEYSPVSYLWPQYWFPYFYAIPSGTYSQASIHGNDPVGYHNYDLSVAYNSLTSRSDQTLLYTNQSTPALIHLIYANRYIYLYGERFAYHSTLASLETFFNIPNLTNSWTAGFFWQYHSDDYENSNQYIHNGPGIGFMYKSITAKTGYQISPEKGKLLKLEHTQFLAQADQKEFGRTYLKSAYYHNKWLPDHHVILLKADASISDRNGRNIRDGVEVGGGEFSGSLLEDNFNVRGYPVGEFVGWSISSATFEYRMPAGESYTRYEGFDTVPLFIKKYHLGFFVDTLTLDGAYYDKNGVFNRTKFWTFYTGVGGELRIDTTMFYHLPITWRAGYHYGISSDALGAGTVFVGLSNSL